MKKPKGEPKRQPKPVDFLNHVDDHACVLLASLGFSNKFICERTGLSNCQVGYRINKAGLTGANHMSRTDFRNGNSPFVNVVLGAAEQVADSVLIKHLKNNL